VATFAEKLIAYVGADITEYVKKVGSTVPAIAKSTASKLRTIGAQMRTALWGGQGRNALGQFGVYQMGILQRAVRAFGRVGLSVFRGVGSAAWGMARGIASAARSATRWAWRKLRTGAIAVGAGLAAATREAVLFESAMAEVWTIFDVGPERLRAMSDEVLKLAARFGEAPARMAKAAYQAISAGVSGDKVGGFLGTAAKAGVAGISDTFTAVDVLTSALNSYGMATSDAMHVSDLLFTTVRLGKTTFGELAGTVARVMPIASQVGVSLEEVSAALGTLTKMGVPTDLAVTSLRQTLVSILNPSGDAYVAANELGIGFGVASLQAQGLGGFLEEVAKKTKGNKEALARLFPNVRALTGVMGLAGVQSREFARQLGAMQGAAGATDKAFEKIADTVGFRLKTAWASIRVSAVKIGDVFKEGSAGWVESLAGWTAKLAKWFEDNEKEIKDTMTRVKDWLGEQWKALCDRMGWDTDDMWFEIQIAAVKAKNWIANMWDGLKTALGKVADAIQGDHETLWDAIKAKAKGAYDRVLEIWKPLKEAMQPLWDAALAALQGDWDKTLAALGTSFGKLLGLAMEVGAKIGKAIVDAMASAMLKAIKNLPSRILDIGDYLNELGRGGANPGEWLGDWAARAAGYGYKDIDPDTVMSGINPEAGKRAAERESSTKAVAPAAGSKSVTNVTNVNNFNYRTTRREQEKIASDLDRLAKRGRLGFAY